MKSAILVFALLVRNRAGRFAGGLAGSLALTAATLAGALLERGTVQRFDMLHNGLPSSVVYYVVGIIA